MLRLHQRAPRTQNFPGAQAAPGPPPDLVVSQGSPPHFFWPRYAPMSYYCFFLFTCSNQHFVFYGPESEIKIEIEFSLNEQYHDSTLEDVVFQINIRVLSSHIGHFRVTKSHDPTTMVSNNYRCLIFVIFNLQYCNTYWLN